MDWSLITRILLVALMLYVFYVMGVPLPAVIVLGILLISFLLLRGHAYRQIDLFLTNRFPSMAGWAPWQKMLLVAVVFLLAYVLLKQAVFWLLKTAGMDVQQMMLDGINSQAK
ncbi:MAG: hypothetical protein NTY83_02260 [Candidatus Micrarchaeota archaeon]|nr:hypothetical protein [Candidatus Micrarchaeota archaeon]